MKIYISADIEGVTGTTHWNETDKDKSDYREFQEQMTAEVTAACQGALAAGATEVWVKDAHGTARNILASRLPREARLLRGWSGHPYGMMEGLDASFQAVMLVGYHSRAGSNTSPLAHTMTGSVVHVQINDRYASEFLINAYIAGRERVPVVFISGDAGLCEDAARLVPDIASVAVKQGWGDATINLHPALAVERIQKGAEDALKKNLTRCQVMLPDHFQVEIRYHDDVKAYGFSFFPGAVLKDPFTLGFETDDYFEVLRLLAFVL